MQKKRIVATLVFLGTLATGFGIGAPAGAADAVPSQAAGGPGAKAVCARLAERATEVPGIRARIRSQVERLERRIAAVADPVRRERLDIRVRPRIDQLESLDERLSELVTGADRRCSGPV